MRVLFNQKTHDYPKKAGNLNLAWYAGGQICIVRKKAERTLQKQNLSIIQINTITKSLWESLLSGLKRDLVRYTLQYKKEYPVLRKRGISAYSIFLILIHALIKRFSLNFENPGLCTKIISSLLANMTVEKVITLRLLKKVRYYYKLNQMNVIRPTVSGNVIELRKLMYNELKSEKMIITRCLCRMLN